MHRKGFAVIPFVIVAAVTLIAATVVYRTSNQRQTTSSQAASAIATANLATWAQVKPYNNSFYPWSNGGPTAGWESYIGNRAYICNTKICWTYDRTTEQWIAPFDMSTDASYSALQPGPGGIKPWTNNGPTAAWTWIIPFEGKTVNENMLCNGNYCWRYIRYPSGTPSGFWRDNGNPIYLPTYNDVWKDTRVSGLWAGNGLTVAWTDPVNSRVTLCNNSYCWSLDYKNWQWRFQVAASAYPSGSMPIKAAWTSPATNIITLCNGSLCWLYNIPSGAYENNSLPIDIKVTPTPTSVPTARPTALGTPPVTPRPTATRTPSPTPRPTAIPTTVPPTTISTVTTDSVWAQTKAISNTFPWTNGGPTAAWESYIPSIGLNRLYVCNTKYCWVYDRTAQQWLNGGNAFDMSTDAGYAVQAGPGGIKPWSNGGPTAAWTWLVKSNNPTEFFNLPNGTELQETLICNKTICWRNIRYPGNPPAGIPASKWRDGGAGKNLSTLNSFWTDTRVAGLWTGDGLTSAWTDRVNKRTTLCNHGYCWSLDYANFIWRFQVSPFPAGKGVSEYTAAWTSHLTNLEYLCNKDKCWQFNITQNAWQNNANPVALYVPPTATPQPTATAAPVLPLNLPIEVSTTKSNFYNIRVTAIRSSAPTTAQPIVCLNSAATAAGTSGATTVTGTCNGLTRGETYRISIMALDKATETPLRPYTTSNYTAPATGSAPLRLTFTMPTPPTVAPTTRPTTAATQIPPTVTVAPTTPPSPQDATINFAVEYSGIASSKTLLPATETQVKIMNGTTVLKTAEVALQRRNTSNIFAPTQAVSVSVPASGINGITVQIKHLTSTTLTVTGLTLTPGQLSSFSPNGEGKLYGGDVNGFNACTNCSYGLIDSYDLNNFLEVLNANRFDTTVDFDRNGTVNLGDFGLIALNYMKDPQTINLRTRDE